MTPRGCLRLRFGEECACVLCLPEPELVIPDAPRRRATERVDVSAADGSYFVAELSPADADRLRRQGWVVRAAEREKFVPSPRGVEEARQRKEDWGPATRNTACKSLARRATSTNGSAHNFVFRQLPRVS